MTTLFDREASVPRIDLETELGVDDVRCLVELELISPAEEDYVPLARIDRVNRLLIASDLRSQRRSPAFVVGPGPASFTLARFIRPAVCGEALDLGCGSGILSLLLAQAGASVVALDINPRAVAFTRFNAALNGFGGISAELGDFLSEDADARFDDRFQTVVSNPPFVLAPSHRLTYRDRPLPGDEVSARTLSRVSRALAAGGRGYLLVNWIGRGERDWTERVRGWVGSAGRDVIAIRIVTRTPVAYASEWTQDLPPADRAKAISEWTQGLAAEQVMEIHAGALAIGRPAGSTTRAPRLEAIDWAVRQVTWQAVEELLLMPVSSEVPVSADPIDVATWMGSPLVADGTLVRSREA